MFADAKRIDAAGLSLNMLCQQFPDDDLRSLIEAGTELRCLFMAPYGKAIQAREQEEDYDAGILSALTEMNISILTQRVRQRLPEEAQQRLCIATYDETIRFNVMLVDRRLAVVQPYMYGARGVESPTLLLRRQHGMAGTFNTFEHTFDWLWERRTDR